MERSKDLFLMMREQEINTNNFLPTKKEINASTKKFVDNLVEAGEIDPIEAISQVVRMEEAIKVVKEGLKDSIPNENFEAYGLKGTYKNGYDKPNFDDDPIYKELKESLKQREAILKLALKSKESIYDHEGIEVPKVSTTPTKGSLTITF